MEDWMISKTILALVLAVSALPFASGAASADPGYPGERGLAGYVREVQQERLTGAPIRIESKCFNACVVKLGATNIEIAPDALLSAHANWAGNAPEDLLNAS